MEFLTEDKIKKAGLSFLKTYYRQRERSGGGANDAIYDVVTEGGIIVDVLLKFDTPEGEPFRAAMEATSALTKEEVTYRLQRTLLFWDCLAASSIIAAMVFSYSYAFDQFTIDQIGLLATMILYVGLMLVIGLIVFFLLKWRNRYQYIYAIEQFKKYHVNEQWIAIGCDVFDHPEDELFLELREQCVVNGFGLVEINFDEESKLLITPSRNEIFGEKREGLAFKRRDTAASRGRVAQYSKLWNEKIGSKIRIPGSEQLKRYQISYVKQALLTGFAFFLTGNIFHIEMKQTDVEYIDEKEYQKKMYRFSENTSAELEEYILDSAALAPIVAEEPGYLQLINENTNEVFENTNEVASDYGDYDEVDQLPLLEMEAIPDEAFKVIFATENGLQVRYDCERLYNMDGRYFLVLDNLYKSAKQAQKRVAKLNGFDVLVNAFSMECFEDGDRRYLVYYDLFYKAEKETGNALNRYRKLLKKRGLSNKNVRTYAIEIKR